MSRSKKTISRSKYYRNNLLRKKRSTRRKPMRSKKQRRRSTRKRHCGGGEITIKIQGFQGQTTNIVHLLSLNVDDSNTIGDVKERIMREKKIPISEQRIVFNGTELTDPTKILSSLGIVDMSTILLVQSPSKKKKTTFPPPVRLHRWRKRQPKKSVTFSEVPGGITVRRWVDIGDEKGELQEGCPGLDREECTPPCIWKEGDEQDKEEKCIQPTEMTSGAGSITLIDRLMNCRSPVPPKRAGCNSPESIIENITTDVLKNQGPIMLVRLQSIVETLENGKTIKLAGPSSIKLEPASGNIMFVKNLIEDLEEAVSKVNDE